MNDSRPLTARAAMTAALVSLPLAPLLAEDPASLSDRLAAARAFPAEFVVEGTSLTSEDPRISILAELPDLDALRAFAGESPIRVNGSTFSFRKDGVHVTVEALPWDHFDSRLREMTTGTFGNFCHESLCFGPGKTGLSDPHGLLSQANPVIHPAVPIAGDSAERFALMVDGLLDRAAGGPLWTTSSEFDAQLAEFVGNLPQSIAEADEIATTVLAHLVALSEAMEDEELAQFLSAPLVASAFLLSDGRAMSEILAARRQLSVHHSSADSGACWLAAFLGAGARVTDGPDRCLGSDDPYAADRNRATLPLALAILDGTSARVPASGDGQSAERFLTWAARHGAAAGDLSLDLDGDGLSALMEYGLGLDPSLADREKAPSVRHHEEGDDRYLTLRYARDLTRIDVRFDVETSTSMAPGFWTTAGVTDEVDGVAPRPDLQSRVARVLRSGERRFLRLRVTKVGEDGEMIPTTAPKAERNTKLETSGLPGGRRASSATSLPPSTVGHTPTKN